MPRALNQTIGAKLSKSPNGIHSVEKIPEGEIRFGPEYFRLRIDGRNLPDKIFGHPMAWSNDSRFLAVQEWLTTDYQKGPITRAVLIDVTSWSIAEFKTVEKGFAESFVITESSFFYLKRFPSKENQIEAKIEFQAIKNWVSI